MSSSVIDRKCSSLNNLYVISDLHLFLFLILKCSSLVVDEKALKSFIQLFGQLYKANYLELSSIKKVVEGEPWRNGVVAL